MTEIGPEHPLTYRQELASPLFEKLHARESCAIIGAASMGKSRLLQFILRDDVRNHYLTDATDTTVLLWVDCNRMAEFTAWGLHELLLTALVEASGEHPATQAQRALLTEWRKEAITTQNGLLAQRYVELALQVLCKEQGLHVCFILDEFDEAYVSLPPQALASLRALRDRHKYQVSYMLFTRDHPRQLRDPDECEGFYELISRSVFGLKPYSDADARRVIEQIATRRGHELSTFGASTIEELLYRSGRHPGLLVALMDALIERPPLGITWEQWAEDQPKAWEECRKIWRGLRREEREVLHQIARGETPRTEEADSLQLKGIITENKIRKQFICFSPLFSCYAAGHAAAPTEALTLDATAGTIWVNGRQTETLSAKEYELLVYLYEHLNQICDPEQIIAHLYPGDEAFNVDPNIVAALVRRVRAKIEPNANRPQYLLNVRGRGYKLVDEPR